MKKLEIGIPDKLYTFIEKKVEEELFESIDSFITHANLCLAELYGYSEEEGVNLSQLIIELITSKLSLTEEKTKQVESVTKEYKIPNMDLIMEAFGSSKFMYSDALYTACVFSRMKKGDQPLSKEEFTKTLEEMEKAGILNKIEQENKIMWKKN